MKILGIESSCDETAAAIVEDGRRLLSSAVFSQIQQHQPFGGVVPEIASRSHCESVIPVTKKALADAGLSLSEVDAIAVTCAPGLIGALLVGVNFAKGLALSSGLPLVPVHHTRGHVASNYLSNPDLEPPFLCLVVSGGHTDLLSVEDYTRFTVLGSTRDDAAGETFDKAARAMGIPYPGGVQLDEIAETGNPNAYPLPRPHVDGAPLDFSFSGLKTAVINRIHNAEQKGETVLVPDMAASLRHAVVECLIGNLIAAAEQTGSQKLVLAGGVSANQLLRRRAEEVCRARGWKLYMPERAFCGDNGAMIASQGYYEFLAGHTAGMELNASANADLAEPGCF